MEADMNPRMTIGRLAKTVGVNIQTVRFYERRRLLAERTKNSLRRSL